MKKLFVLFVCVFTVVQLYGQQHIRETYPTVRFQCMDNRGDSVVITQEELPVHFELYYDGKRAGLLSPSVYWDNPDLEFGYGSPKTDPRPKSAQAWEAWLCARIIPKEIKDKLNLASRYEDDEISYLCVEHEIQIMVRFEKRNQPV